MVNNGSCDEIIARLKEESSKCKTIGDYVNLAFSLGGAILPQQNREEIIPFLKILKNFAPGKILEIGTNKGGTLYLFAKIAAFDATLISVDLPGGSGGGGYPESRIPFYKSFGSSQQKIHLLRKDSHSKETLYKVKEILNFSKLDFLFIDGDHSYEGVKQDFEMYGPLVSEKGIIALHDICAFEPNGGVKRFWNEIKNSYKYEELVRDWNQRVRGIGIIYK